jgi:transcription-repair coupling factor (superfamily II helicase)
VDRKRDQIHIRFTGQASVDPGRLMKMVAQNAKKGAQFTPQGVLRFPLKATEPLDVLEEIKALLEELAAREAVEVAGPQRR